MRILIIEDAADVAASMKMLLELDGHEVAIAVDGPEGIQLARAFEPHVVFCDIGLPGMDGYEVARAMQADAELRGIFRVAISGYALPGDVARAGAAGFHRHIAKPANPEDIRGALLEVDGRRV